MPDKPRVKNVRCCCYNCVVPPRRKYTDDALRVAIRESTTFRAAAKHLGIRTSGDSYANMRDRIHALDLDTSHFTQPAHCEWDEDELRSVVAASTSYVMVAAALGRAPAGKTFRRMQNRIRALGISTRHFVPRVATSVRYACRWSDDELRAAVASSDSYAETIRKLGLIPAGGNYGSVQRRIKEIGVNTSHFTGAKWHADKPTSIAPIPLEEMLVANRWTGTAALKERLFRAGLKKRACELCGWAESAPDGRVPVELDHANGDNTDNRLENLRILCPNCHSLQPTHRGLNQKRRRS